MTDDPSAAIPPFTGGKRTCGQVADLGGLPAGIKGLTQGRVRTRVTGQPPQA